MIKTLYELRCIWSASLQLLQINMTDYPHSEALKEFYEKKKADVKEINEMLKDYNEYTPADVILKYFRERKAHYKFFGMVSKPRSYFSITQELQAAIEKGL